MSETVIQKLDCNDEKITQYGHDKVCGDVFEWQVSFGSTSYDGRCPRCEEDRLYHGEGFLLIYR